MDFNLPQSRASFAWALILCGLSSLPASAAGYYNFGMHWKGGINPDQLGAQGTFNAGFTSGLGATSVSGSGDGVMSNPYAVVLGPSGDFYVADHDNHRIEKYNSSGIFQGWIGEISASPTGGAAGCNGAAVGSVTPGWCLGGASGSGSGDGMMISPMALSFDSSGNFYVVDYDNSRIVKYNSSGVFQGWIGSIATSPTGGAAGCNGAAVGAFTPGWCKGGTSQANVGDGMLNYPSAVKVDSSDNLYVADTYSNRISKYNSAGAFQGWIGKIGSSPTGGAAGCNGAAFGTVTPGWCKGGASMQGQGDGMMSLPSGIALDSSGNLYVADTSNHRISKYNSAGVFQGWTGKIATSPTSGAAGCNGASVGTATPGWCKGGTASSGSGDGMMNNPTGAALDSSGNFYVSDTNNHRINKFDSTGVFQGWIGMVSTSPTGGAAGCNGAAYDTMTPGWCKGGASGPESADGMMTYPRQIDVDSSGNLYVADSGNSRINKYTSSGAVIGALQSTPAYFSWHRSSSASTAGVSDGMMDTPSGMALDSSGNLYVADAHNFRVNKYDSSGTFQGWIGKIKTSPTSGAAGCNGAAAGTATPGWCKGGTAASGSGDGMFDYPNDVALDSSGNLYVTDHYNARINKFNSSGVFQGWIGKIATSPTGGAAGCNGASVGTFTPGWCKGGTSGTGTGDGMLNHPEFLTVDSSGNLYVTEDSSHRLSQFNSSGAFQGWIGKIATSPTGGAAGCNGASVGTFTPGWCKGGTSSSGTGNGMMNDPGGVALDSSGNLYVADTNNHRINKYNSSGVFQGWIGEIATSPTGGAAGCNGASVGTFTPGWCTGGTSGSGTGDGMMTNPSAVYVDSHGTLYVADHNNRINKYNSSGVFQGWIGEIATSPTGGATGCNGASVGTITPGWCKGGTSGSGTVDGMMNAPTGLRLDQSGNLYVVDSSNHRVLRFSIQGK